jgi:hypothetical protein
MSNQEKMDQLAAPFGDPKTISLFLGREKVYPGKDLTDDQVNRIETALRSPESEKATLRVLEGKALIYRSSQGQLDVDTKGVAAQLQQSIEAQAVPSQTSYFELLNSHWQGIGQGFRNEQQLTNEINHSRQVWNDKGDFAIDCDKQVMEEALIKGLSKSETLSILEQSPQLKELTKPEYHANAADDYRVGLAEQYDQLSQGVEAEPPATPVSASEIAASGATQVPEITQDVQTLQTSPPTLDYLELLNSGLSQDQMEPYASLESLQTELAQVKQEWNLHDSGIPLDDLVINEAVLQGASKEETLAVLEQSPHLEELGRPEYDSGAKDEYREGLGKQFDRKVELLMQKEHQLPTPAIALQASPQAVVAEAQPEVSPQLAPIASKIPEQLPSSMTEAQSARDPLRQAIERHIASEQQARSASVATPSEPTAIVLATKERSLIPFPINSSQPQLDEKMRELLNPPEATNHASLEQALVAANARIDLLQQQLGETKQALEKLSAHVKDSEIGAWASQKVQQISHTSQRVAEQAKQGVMHWMQSKSTQVKQAVTETVEGVKTAAQEKITEVKTAAQLKGIDIKEATRERINNMLAPVNVPEVERSARHIIETYGNGNSYDKATTHSFSLNPEGNLSIARQSDKAVIYEKGALTDRADSRDVLKLNSLPQVLNQIQSVQAQQHSQQQLPTQKQEMEVGT